MDFRVIDTLVRSSADAQTVALGNGQGAVYGIGYNVLSGGINLARSTLGEGDGISIRIGALAVCGDSLEGDVVGREAVNRLKVSGKGLGVGIGSEGHILIVIEDDLIGAGSDGHRLLRRGHGGAACNGDGGFGIGFPVGTAGHGFGIGNGFGSAVPVVVDGVAQVRPLGVGNRALHIGGAHGAGDSSLAGGVAGNHWGINRVGIAGIHGCGIVIGSLGSALVHIVDGQPEAALLPHGVEDIGAGVIHHDFAAGLILGGRGGGAGGPAHKLIAFGSGEAVPHGHGLVVHAGNRHIIGSPGDTGGIVGLVGQDRGIRLVAPDGGKGDVGGLNLNLVAGLIGFPVVLPAQEHLALRGGEAIGMLHIGKGAVGILLGIGHGAGARTGIIGYGELLVAGIVGVEGNIAVDLGVEIEGEVVAIGIPGRPAPPGEASRDGDLGKGILVDGGAIGNLNLLGIAAAHCQIGSTGIGRRGPLGIYGNVLGRHGAGEHILLALPQLIIVPAHELILRGNAHRTGGGVGHIGDVLLVLLRNRIFYRAIVDKFDLIGVTVVVELRSAVRISVL